MLVLTDLGYGMEGINEDSQGGSTYVSSLANRLPRDPKERHTLAAHERTMNAESELVEKGMR